MLRNFDRLRNSRLFQNTAALYGVQFCRKLLPVLTIPYLTLVLGPSGWGTMAFVLSSATFLILLTEFGFSITATRAIAQNRDSRQACSEIVAGVLGLQFILFLAGSAGVLVFARNIPLLRHDPRLLWAGMFFAISQCFMPIWFFQGMEWMRSVSVIEISGKLLALAGLVIFVHVPSDAWKALAIQGIPFLMQTVVGLWMIYTTFPFRMPTWVLLRKSVENGWTMFLFRSGVVLYTTATTVILGLVASAEVVGYYAAAERINRSILGLLNPIQDAFFPRISRLANQSPSDAARIASIGALVTSGAGILLPVAIYFSAPWLIALFAGARFGPSVGTLRILSLLIPFAALNMSASLQYLLPLGKDRIVCGIALAGGVLSVVLCAILARRFGLIGTAWAAVTAEAFVGVAAVWAAFRFTTIWRLRAETSAKVAEEGLPVLLHPGPSGQ